MSISTHLLRAGDVVRLKSDSPPMSIGVLTDTELVCLWADSSDSIQVFNWFGCRPNPDLFERAEELIDPAPSQIVAGGRARLRSSRQPLLTVHSIRPNESQTYLEADCFWFTRSQQQVFQTIPVEALAGLSISEESDEA